MTESHIIKQPVTNLATYNADGALGVCFTGIDKEYKDLIDSYEINIGGDSIIKNIAPSGREKNTIGDLPEGTEILVDRDNIPTRFIIAKHNYYARSASEAAPITCLIQLDNCEKIEMYLSETGRIDSGVRDTSDADFDKYPTALSSKFITITHSQYDRPEHIHWNIATVEDFTCQVFAPSVVELGYTINTSNQIYAEQGTDFESSNGIVQNIIDADYIITRTTNGTTMSIMYIHVRDDEALSATGSIEGVTLPNCFCVPMSTQVKISESNPLYYEFVL